MGQARDLLAALSRAAGERLREAQSINRSLAALGDVVQALQARQAFVPYRRAPSSVRRCAAGCVPRWQTA